MPPPPGDPPALYAIARHLAEQADALRTAATRTESSASTVHWQSPAGMAFRSRTHETAQTMRRCAGRMDAAAELVRRHAGRVSAGFWPLETGR
jgi:hypothetical protein